MHGNKANFDAGKEKKTMRYVIRLSICLMVGVLLGGCTDNITPPELGGGGTPPGEPSIMERLAADLAAVGKTMPDLLRNPQAAPGATRALMPELPLGKWKGPYDVPQGRWSWFEINLTEANSRYNATVRPSKGDPDLFVFTPPVFVDDNGRLKGGLVLIGYSVHRVGDDEVRGLVPKNLVGTGRYVIGVYGYAPSPNRFKILFWK
jgi:hypothetical protein